jgi:hypothetical protein
MIVILLVVMYSFISHSLSTVNAFAMHEKVLYNAILLLGWDRNTLLLISVLHLFIIIRLMERDIRKPF